MSAASSLQAAIFERLTGDATLTGLVGADGVTDRILPRPKLPLIVLRSIDSAPRSSNIAATWVSIARFSVSGTSAPASPKPAVKSISMPFIAWPGSGRSGSSRRDGRAAPSST